MKLIGYSDLLSVEAGQTLQFMVSSENPSYDAQLVRLIHGDRTSDGPGFKEQHLESAVLARAEATLRLRAYVLSTAPGMRAEGLLTRWDAATDSGYALVLDESGAPAVWLGDGSRVQQVTTHAPLTPWRWYEVSAKLDATAGTIAVSQRPLRQWPVGDAPVEIAADCELRPVDSDGPFVIAAWHNSAEDPWHDKAGHFNGKIDRPVVWRGQSRVAEWDFSQEIGTARIVEVSGAGLHGTAVNMPMRGVTGHNFTGREIDFRQLPEEYGAIFFHDDDLEDARWSPDFELRIPSDLRSAVYAIRLHAGSEEDYVPFFVRPPRGTASARVALLLPTYTYLAYANAHPEHPGPALNFNEEEFFGPADGRVDRRRDLWRK